MSKAALVLLVCLTGSAADNLPPDALACLKSAGPDYIPGDQAAPKYLRGDFDGDGRPDLAVLTRRDARGVAVCLSGKQSAIVLGAGRIFNYMKDLDFTAWRLERRGAPGGRRDAFVLEWESASGLVYWNGAKFSWRQLGD